MYHQLRRVGILLFRKQKTIDLLTYERFLIGGVEVASFKNGKLYLSDNVRLFGADEEISPVKVNVKSLKNDEEPVVLPAGEDQDEEADEEKEEDTKEVTPQPVKTIKSSSSRLTNKSR